MTIYHAVLERDGMYVSCVEIDENNEALARTIFSELGHTTDGCEVVLSPVEEEE